MIESGELKQLNSSSVVVNNLDLFDSVFVCIKQRKQFKSIQFDYYWLAGRKSLASVGFVFDAAAAESSYESAFDSLFWW